MSAAGTRSRLTAAAFGTGISLFVASLAGVPAGLARSTPAAAPFTLRANTIATNFPIDPAVGTNFPNIEKAICSTLVTYPERWPPAATRLTREVASKVAVSRGGKRYTFTIRKGFRFSDGSRVTAATFAAAINRDLDPQLISPGASYLHEVVGADAVLDGRAKRAAGVRANGAKLVIELTRRAPDFLSRMALTFFCPVPPGTPPTPQLRPAASGPYYVASFDPRRLLVLKRNSRYHGTRPRRAAEIDWTLGEQFDAIRLEVEKGTADVGLLSPQALAGIPERYGVNRRRFWRVTTLQVNQLVFNNESPLFRNNVALRKAINYLVDRRALASTLGPLSGPTTDQILSWVMPGFRNARLYPLRKPNVPLARRLARGNTRSGKALIVANNATPTAVARAQVLQAELRLIGIDGKVEVDNPFRPRARTRGTDWDIYDGAGVTAAYPDPGALLAPSFDGRLIVEKNNTNIAYFRKRWVERRLDRIARLRGRARLRAAGRLDVDLMRREAPVAPYSTFAFAVFVSNRVGCVQMSSISSLNLGAMCLRGR